MEPSQPRFRYPVPAAPSHPAITHHHTLAILNAASFSGHSTRTKHTPPHSAAPASLLAHLDLSTAPTHPSLELNHPCRSTPCGLVNASYACMTYGHPQLGLIQPGQLHLARRTPQLTHPFSITDTPTLCPSQTACSRSVPGNHPSWPPGTMIDTATDLNLTRAVPQAKGTPNNAASNPLTGLSQLVNLVDVMGAPSGPKHL